MTYQALILRVLVGLVVGVPAGGLAFLHLLWLSPLGLAFAVPAGYLLYVAVKDTLTLVRRRAPQKRPRFLWFALAGVLCIGYWSSIFWT